MEIITKEITEGVFGLAFWLNEWNSYINCYLMRDEAGYRLIDTGIEDHKEDLLSYLSENHILKSAIHTIIATHGHKDHIGNVDLFENATKYIHEKDIQMVNDSFTIISENSLQDMNWVNIGVHTPGSIALYYPQKKILFIGDEVCFFGLPITNGNLVNEENEIRETMIDFMASEEFNIYLRTKETDVLAFANALIFLASYDIEYLCSGHGVVLEHHIPLFLSTLADQLLKKHNSLIN